MRIAVVAHSAARLGGVETYLAAVVPALTARGHDVGCWFESAPAGAEPILAADYPGRLWIGTESPADPLAALRAWNPEVIYQHGLRSAAIEAQLGAIAPVAFFAHSYYGACISGERSTRFPVTMPCERVFGPACLAHYFPRQCGGSSPVTMVRQYRLQRMKQRLLRGYSLVLVASRHMARDYERQQIPTRVLQLPIADQNPPMPRNRESRRFLFVGRLERSKGVDIALHSAAYVAEILHKPVRLVVAGHGSQGAALARQSQVLMRRNPALTVQFPGWLTETARAAALAETDLLLMPSVWPEPFGLAGVEAAAAGVPAIAFDVGGIGDWLRDRVTGRLVALEGDRVRGFADAILETIANPGRLDAMRREAMAKARTFTMAAHVGALEDMLHELAQKASPERCG